MVNADVGSNGSVEVSHKYDALGRRVARTESGTTTIFVQSGQQTLADYASGAAPSSSTYRYLYASYIDEPVLRFTASGSVSHYYHRNQQFSIYAITNSSAGIVERYAYASYGAPTVFDGSGNTLQTSNFSIRHAYTGREWDSTTQQYHFRARIFDASIGRFGGRDPIGYHGGINLQTYVYNSPANYIDPSGMYQYAPSPKLPTRPTRPNPSRTGPWTPGTGNGNRLPVPWTSPYNPNGPLYDPSVPNPFDPNDLRPLPMPPGGWTSPEPDPRGYPYPGPKPRPTTPRGCWQQYMDCALGSVHLDNQDCKDEHAACMAGRDTWCRYYLCGETSIVPPQYVTHNCDLSYSAGLAITFITDRAALQCRGLCKYKCTWPAVDWNFPVLNPQVDQGQVRLPINTSRCEITKL